MRYTKENLEPVIKGSTTWAEVCRKLGVKPVTGGQSHVRRRADDFGIDYSHFVGQGWSKGKTFTKRPLVEYLVEHSSLKSHELRKRLIREGFKEPKCETCGLSSWLGQEPPLELDHINDDHFDCRIENLQILCANCHALKTRAAVSQRKRTQF